jgi:hypothetical protein
MPAMRHATTILAAGMIFLTSASSLLVRVNGTELRAMRKTAP